MEIATFLKLLEEEGKKVGDEWKLIYRASRDGLDRYNCIDKVYGKPNIMLFIHTEGDNVCGGFTKTGWKRNGGHESYSTDSKAFIFSLRSCKGFVPCISNIEPNNVSSALFYWNRDYCGFGCFDLFMSKSGTVHATASHYGSFPNRNHLLGGEREETIKDFEIFELK